jgi:fucose 4-O-acetylase-like acetyltransferase
VTAAGKAGGPLDGVTTVAAGAGESVRSRNVHLDVLRALAITMVVFGHAVFSIYKNPMLAPQWAAAVFSVVVTFHVPLFMFVGGYVTRRDLPKTWVGGRALRLLVPFFAWAVLQWLFWYRADPGWLPRILVDPFETNALWFLYVLFVCSAVFYLLRRWDWALVAVAALCIVTPIPTTLFGMQYVQIYMPYFVVGHFLGRAGFRSGWWWLLAAPVVLAILWTQPGANPQMVYPAWMIPLRDATIAYPLGLAALAVRAARFAGGLSLIAAVWYVVGFVPTDWRLTRGAAWLGANTIGVYCASPFFLIDPPVRGGTVILALTAFAMAASALVTAVLKRWDVTRFLLLGGGVVPPAWKRGATWLARVAGGRSG